MAGIPYSGAGGEAPVQRVSLPVKMGYPVRTELAEELPALFKQTEMFIPVATEGPAASTSWSTRELLY